MTSNTILTLALPLLMACAFVAMGAVPTLRKRKQIKAVTAKATHESYERAVRPAPMHVIHNVRWMLTKVDE